jgi:hypothetical protein
MYWKGDIARTNTDISITMNQAVSVEAVFGTMVSTTVSGPGRVKLVPAFGPYPYGSVVLVEGLPDAGNYLGRWGNAARGAFNPLAFVVTNANPTVSSLFAAIPDGQVLLNIPVAGSGYVTANPDRNVFNAGEQVTLTAVPGPGQSFFGWTGAYMGMQTPLTMVMDGDKTIQANFENYRIELLPLGLDNGIFRLTLHGPVGLNYKLQGTRNLVDWLDILTTNSMFNDIPLADPGAAGISYKYYRVLQER